MNDRIPSHQELYNPVLRALKELGGSGSLHEINGKVIESLELPPDLLQQPHDPETGNESEIEYRLAWARTYLKKYGLLDNSTRGIWALTDRADRVSEVNPTEVSRFVRSLPGRSIRSDVDEVDTSGADDVPEELAIWRGQLHRLLVTELTASAFERLVQRVLRESGFIQVEVCWRSGDGGIDGKGNCEDSRLDELPREIPVQAIYWKCFSERNPRLPWCDGW